MILSNEKRGISRRNFIKLSAKLSLGACLAAPTSALCGLPSPKSLKFYHTHTYEHFEIPYFNKPYPSGFRVGLDKFLRDHRTGETHPIDFRLMLILNRISEVTGSSGVYEVISAYRSQQTNRDLRRKSRGVAQKSLHLLGQAIDVRLTDISTKDLRDAAISLKAGGVGYYAKANFVHIDTGNFRTW